MIQIQDIFPTPIGLVKYTESLDSVKNVMMEGSKQAVKNVANAHTEDTYILNRPDCVNLKTWIESQLQQYFVQTINPQSDCELYITQSWINYTNPGEHHHAHSHANSLISGVFYLHTNPGKDSITFLRPEDNQISIEPKQQNLYNASGITVSVETSDLVMFPSRLKHMVNPLSESDMTRVSLAVNTFVKGTIGSDKMLSSLTIQ